MRRRPYKQKPGPKRGTVTTPPELWCGFIKEDGTPCRTRKQRDEERCAQHKKYNSNFALKDFEAFLPGQSYELPPDVDIRSIDDLLTCLSDTLNRVRVGKLPVNIGNSVAGIARELTKLVIAKEKLSPEKQALRAFSKERAAQLAREMTLEQAQEIARSRNTSLFAESCPAEPQEKATVIDISDPSDDAKAMLEGAEKTIKRIEASAKRIIEDLPALAMEEDEPDEEIEDE